VREAKVRGALPRTFVFLPLGADAPTFERPAPLQAWATTRRRLPLTDDELRIIAGNVAPYMR
jgi:hypothetical protein